MIEVSVVIVVIVVIALKTQKSKDELISEWASDKVTYWAVLDS